MASTTNNVLLHNLRTILYVADEPRGSKHLNLDSDGRLWLKRGSVPMSDPVKKKVAEVFNVLGQLFRVRPQLADLCCDARPSVERFLSHGGHIQLLSAFQKAMNSLPNVIEGILVGSFPKLAID